MAAVDRLDDLEQFLLDLQPEDVPAQPALAATAARPPRVRPAARTIETRFGDLVELARDVRESEIELVVCATDATPAAEALDTRDYELVYSSRRKRPGDGAGDPRLRGDQRARASGSCRRPPRDRRLVGAELPARTCVPSAGVTRSWRSRPSAYPSLGAAARGRLRLRLGGFGRVPPMRAFVEELRLAEERDARGEPPTSEVSCASPVPRSSATPSSRSAWRTRRTSRSKSCAGWTRTFAR